VRQQKVDVAAAEVRACWAQAVGYVGPRLRLPECKSSAACGSSCVGSVASTAGKRQAGGSKAAHAGRRALVRGN